MKSDNCYLFVYRNLYTGIMKTSRRYDDLTFLLKDSIKFLNNQIIAKKKYDMVKLEVYEYFNNYEVLKLFDYYEGNINRCTAYIEFDINCIMNSSFVIV